MIFWLPIGKPDACRCGCAPRPNVASSSRARSRCARSSWRAAGSPEQLGDVPAPVVPTAADHHVLQRGQVRDQPRGLEGP